jgi:hypothetical protein
LSIHWFANEVSNVGDRTVKMKLVPASVLMSLLSACGGGSTGLDVPSFNNAFAVASASGAALERIDDLNPSERAQVQSTGSATYAGTILITQTDMSPDVIGGMAIAVDFANDANISGGAASFFDATGSAVSGSLALSDAAIARSDSETRLTGDLQGRLNGITVEGETEDVTYDLEIGGSFLGANAQALSGGLTGTATIVDGGEMQDRDGTFVLEQN